MSLINIILLLGAAQGILLSVLIFQKHSRLFANRFLGSLMFLYSIVLLNLLFSDLGYDVRFPHLMLIPIGIPFLIGPLHYLYAKHLIYSLKRFRKIEWLHFVPFLLYELFIIPDFFKARGEIITSIENIHTAGLPLKYIILNWVITLQSLTYMFLIISILKQYSRDIKDIFSSIEKIKLNWLRNITYMVVMVLVIFIIENIFYLSGINLSNYFNLTSLLFALSVYAMGYMGLLKSEIFTEPQIAASMSQIIKLGYTSRKDQQDISQTTTKYEKSGLSSDKAKHYLEKLFKLMKEEKPNVDSNLTLTQLAEKLTISPHNLSEVLNTQLNQNFFDFVNQYRIDDVKKDLTDPQKQHLKILAIAFDAGFNSKTSFNTIFKKYTNMTPSEFRQQVLQKKAS